MNATATRCELDGAPKPLLRGWIHAIAAPVTLTAVVLLILRSPTAPAAIAAGTFAVSAITLFSTVAAFACQYIAVLLVVQQAA